MRSLDVFTGIGGMTHALRGLATPVVYCENEPTRIAALQTLIKKGELPEADIHDDVCTLDAQAYAHKDIGLVVGGGHAGGGLSLENTKDLSMHNLPFSSNLFGL